jgi:outer membrane protein OmpA-like peptidoglycan-associated protein
LVNGGVDASRISAEGKGVKNDAASNEQARTAIITEVK